MSIPEQQPADATNPYSEENINKLTTELTTDKGVKVALSIPDDLDPILATLVTSENRRRETQAEYTRVKQKEALQAKELEALKASIPTLASKATLTEEQLAELEELKTSDVDAWRAKANEYEAQLATAHKESITNVLTTASTESVKSMELQQLAEYNANSPHEITQEDLDYNIPPRLAMDYKAGKYTYSQYLELASNILFAGVTTKIKADDDNTTQEEEEYTIKEASFDAIML